MGGLRPLSSLQSVSWNDSGKAAILGLGWQMGNLEWDRLQDIRPLHGVAIIGQGDSLKSMSSQSADASTDRHELGHILMNDGSHRDSPKNMMAGGGERTSLDKDQCELIRALIISKSLCGMLQFAPSGKRYGGLTTMLALNSLSHSTLNSSICFSEDADSLEKILRIEEWAEFEANALRSRDHGAKLEDLNFVRSFISSQGKSIWKKVVAHKIPPSNEQGGIHSYQVVVTDREGNAITGTNTIESFPWGQGLFVGGVALTDSGKLNDQTIAGQRNFMPFSMIPANRIFHRLEMDALLTHESAQT